MYKKVNGKVHGVDRPGPVDIEFRCGQQMRGDMLPRTARPNATERERIIRVSALVTASITERETMAEPPSKDPGAVWRDLVTQWEKNLNELANRTMGSDEFSKSMNRALSLSAGMQSSLQEAMARYLASLNLPSRTEMEGIGERLRGIEDRLDRLLAALQPPGAAQPGGDRASAKPPRTKRPPGRGEKK
jgi:hypothetical protein